MEDKVVEILLVEDDPNDVELTLHAFKTHNLAKDAVDNLMQRKVDRHVFCQ